MADTWLGRFRIDGTNWEGREWRLAPSLVTLARQISEKHPDGEAGDGTVASKRHDEVSPFSDHRPRPFTGPGIVRAIDAGESQDADPMVAALVASRDPRIAYIIYEGQIWRSYDKPGIPAWQGAPYSGPAPHNRHFHLSILRSTTADNDTRPWQIGGSSMGHPYDGHVAFRQDHDIGSIPDWSPWDTYVDAGGTTVPESGTWAFTRADMAWVWDKFIRPLAAENADLRKRVKALEDAPVSGGGQLEIDTETVQVVRSVRVVR